MIDSSKTSVSDSIHIDIKERFVEVRNYSEKLCKPLKVEDYIPQPVMYVSPPKWHLGHTTWFFEEMILKPFSPGYKPSCKNFKFIFNSYYNTLGKRVVRADRGNLTRPTVEEVFEYRSVVSQAILEFMDSMLCDSSALKLLELGISHEEQHQELLISDLKFILGHNPLFPVYKKDFSLVADHNTEFGEEIIEEGLYNVGYSGNGFSYDNELDNHKVYLNRNKINKALVTNGEYMEFIEAGGYNKFEYWLDEGWEWVNKNKISAPLYWYKIEDEWFYYTLAGLTPVDTEAIVSHVSFYESSAYAEWCGKRLPTEFEWEVGADKFKWGKRWEWTNSAYLPYPGFTKAKGAVGEYNGKFMINQMVLRGSSVATSKGHSRITYRNFFHPFYQWQFSGIRLADKYLR